MARGPSLKAADLSVHPAELVVVSGEHLDSEVCLGALDQPGLATRSCSQVANVVGVEDPFDLTDGKARLQRLVS